MNPQKSGKKQLEQVSLPLALAEPKLNTTDATLRFVGPWNPPSLAKVCSFVCAFVALVVLALSVIGWYKLWVLLFMVLPVAMLYVFVAVALMVSLMVTEIKMSPKSVILGFSVSSFTGVAALLAGRRRMALRPEWAAHLAGESGHDPVSREKVKDAFGFLVSGILYRYQDMTDAVWIPIDALLKSRILSNISVLLPTIVAGSLVLRHEGTLGVITSAESIAAIAAALYGLIRTGRWWRGIKLAEPKARRTKKDT